MPRRARPAETSRSEHWLRVAVNDRGNVLDRYIRNAFSWPDSETLEWRSPVRGDDFAEYYDEEFLKRLGVGELPHPLKSFWPKSGPRWDGLARTSGHQLILVEAKAYIEEGVDYRSGASPKSLALILGSLEEAKRAFKANANAPWETPFYQYANRLAHLYFMVEKNRLDAYLVFLYFADAPDVPAPCSKAEWEGARRLTEKCLGLGTHAYSDRIATITLSVPELLSSFWGD